MTRNRNIYRIKSREMKFGESANKRIYGDASIINYGFIIIAPNSRDGARFARRRDSFNDAASRTRTTTCAHPSSSPPHPRCAGEADAVGVTHLSLHKIQNLFRSIHRRLLVYTFESDSWDGLREL